MPNPRITMKDVAQKLGVHTTTVSLALRNSPKLPAETRERVRSLAKKMGYHQDPMLSALTAYRTTLAGPKTQPTVAMIFDFENQGELAFASPSYRHFQDGVARKTEELGYKLQRFFFQGASRHTEGRRIGHVLVSRGITGVILCAFRTRTTTFALEWDQFSAVQIECQHLNLPLPLISTDQLMMAREAVRRLWQRGYRRIGIAIGRDEEVYLDHAFTVGFHGEAALHPELAAAPPLLLANGLTSDAVAPILRQWVQQHKIEAVISNWTTVLAALTSKGPRPASDPITVILGDTPEQSIFGGMRSRDEVVGERAMEQLAMLLKTNQTGRIETPNRILIPGIWIEGTPPAASEQAQATCQSSVSVAAEPGAAA